MDPAPRFDRTALVVDDDPFVLSAMAEILSEDGYDVHTASNGFSALRLAAEFRPLVVLLDLALPERSGGEVMAELRSDLATHTTAIVLVTGRPHLLTEAQLAEADGMVLKPFDPAELLRTVNQAVQRAAMRRVEVLPVAATSHRQLAPRQERPTSGRRTRGRR